MEKPKRRFEDPEHVPGQVELLFRVDGDAIVPDHLMELSQDDYEMRGSILPLLEFYSPSQIYEMYSTDTAVKFTPGLRRPLGHLDAVNMILPDGGMTTMILLTPDEARSLAYPGMHGLRHERLPLVMVSRQRPFRSFAERGFSG